MPIGNPDPLGLGSFALTTFVLSCYNAGVFGVSTTDPVNVIVGLALFYGGLAQILAGMWELAVGNTFAATAFTSYGAFWLSYATLLLPGLGVVAGYGKAPLFVFLHAASIYLLAWTIFTFIMLLASFRTTIGLVLLFLMLTVTFCLLTAAEFGSACASLQELGSFTGVHKAAGFFGIVTAAIAWYNALSGLLDSQPNPPFTLPVGRIRRLFVVASASSSPAKGPQ